MIKKNEFPGYISLDHYLSKIIEQNSSYSNIDVRLTEWSCLEIIRQIAEQLNNTVIPNDIFNNKNKNAWKIHPANFLVPIQWVDYKENTWKSWKKMVSEKKIELIDGDLRIDDYRYLPLNKLWRRQSISWFFGMRDFSTVIGLTSLLIKLLSKSFEWPGSTNKLVFIDKVYTNIVNTLNRLNVSTDTRTLITIIFEKKDVDFFVNRDFAYVMNKKNISTIGDYIMAITALQKKLEKRQLSIYGGHPRQLTVIDIDELNRLKSII